MNQCCENCGVEFEPEDSDQLQDCAICGTTVCPRCYTRPLFYTDGVWTKSGDVSCRYCYVTEDESAS